MDRLCLILAFGVAVVPAIHAGGQLRPSGAAPEKSVQCSPSISVDRRTPSTVPAPVRLKLRHYVPPEYPAVAREARVQGKVTISMRVGENGKVVSARLISGHPILAPSTLKAVHQWRYHPACVNGSVAVWEQFVSVSFSLKNGVSVAQGEPPLPAAPNLAPGAMPYLSASDTRRVVFDRFLNIDKWDNTSGQWQPASAFRYCRGFNFDRDPVLDLLYRDQHAYYQELETELARSLTLGTSLRDVKRQLQAYGLAYDECSGSDKLRFNSKLTIRPHEEGLAFSRPVLPVTAGCLEYIKTYLVFDDCGHLAKKDSAITLGPCRR